MKFAVRIKRKRCNEQPRSVSAACCSTLRGFPF